MIATLHDMTDDDTINSVAPPPVANAGGGSAPRARPRSPPEPLQEATIRWLSELPEKVRPLELARLFPRVANKLCSLQSDPLLSKASLTSLLMDGRDGSREGFPMAVAAELAALFSSAESSTQDHAQAKPESGGRQAPEI